MPERSSSTIEQPRLVADRGAGRRQRADAVEHGDRLLARVLAGLRRVLRRAERPVAELLQVVVGVGADDGDRLHLRRVERQQAVVLEQHQALARGGEVGGAVVGPRDLDGGPGEVGPARVLEQAHAELQREQPLHGRVDLRLLQPAAAHGLDRALVELRRGHHDVVAGAQRHDRGVGVGRRQTFCSFTRRPTLSQSVTSTPLKPHSFLRTSVSSQRFAVEGTPSIDW